MRNKEKNMTQGSTQDGPPVGRPPDEPVPEHQPPPEETVQRVLNGLRKLK